MSANGIRERLDLSYFRKVFIVGDIHGKYSQLMSNLDSLGFREQSDFVVSTGDLIDRGDENLECVGLLSEPWFKCVMGNHESLFIKSEWHNKSKSHDKCPYAACHYVNGGNWVDSVDSSELEHLWHTLRGLPLGIEIKRKDNIYGVVHAYVPHHNWEVMSCLTEELMDRVMWDRHWGNAMRSPSKFNIHPVLGVDHVFIGHTPQEEISTQSNITCLDISPKIGIWEV